MFAVCLCVFVVSVVFPCLNEHPINAVIHMWAFDVGLGPATKVRACRKRFQRLLTVTKELLSQKKAQRIVYLKYRNEIRIWLLYAEW